MGSFLAQLGEDDRRRLLEAGTVTTVERDAPEVIRVSAVRHPSEREIVAMRS